MKRILFMMAVLFSPFLLAEVENPETVINNSVIVTEVEVKSIESKELTSGTLDPNSIEKVKTTAVSVLPELEPINAEGRSNRLVIYAVMLISLVWLVIGAASLFPKDSAQEL